MESKMAALAATAAEAACRVSQTPILVFGDSMLDSSVEGSVTRISPEAPVPVLCNPSDDQYAIGGAGNVAHNLQKLRNSVRLVSGVGSIKQGQRDLPGMELVEQIKKAGLASDYLVDLERRTTVKQRIIAGKQQILRIDKEQTSSLSASEEAKVISALESAFDGVAAIIISDYDKGILTEKISQLLCQRAKENKIPLLADIKLANLSKLSQVSLLKPNLKEAQEFTGMKFSGQIEQIAAMAKALSTRFSCQTVITCGGLGMVLYDGTAVLHLKAKTKDVYDVSGAGDTVIAALAHGLIRGLSLEESATLATMAAGIAVSRRGVIAVSLNDIENELGRKIVPKTWGHEEWIVNADYCGKKLVLNIGQCCSLHYHKIKDETFYIASGRVGFQLNDQHFILIPGDSLLITPGTKHRFYGLEDSEIFEFSTHHMEEDSYRDEVSGTFDPAFFDKVPTYRDR